MRTIAFVGPSGTGKSYRALMVARKYGADAILDDGLLISENKVLAGISAKREPTKLASVRRALFVEPDHARQVRNALCNNRVRCVMILGTSDAMAEKIAKTLQLPEIEQIIHIEDVSTQEEMQMAKEMRQGQGKHVIPVPTFEIKKDFSGYFMHPLRMFQKSMDTPEKDQGDKTIVRPTFSYMGDYTISDNVIAQIAAHEALKIKEVYKVNGVNIRKTEHGAHIELNVVLWYGCRIQEVCNAVQHTVVNGVERYSAVNARRVHVLVKGLKM